MAKPVKCRDCHNWFLCAEDRMCPHCIGIAIDDPKVPYELTEEDIRILRVQGIAVTNDHGDDGA